MIRKIYNFIKANRLLTGILLTGIALRLIFFLRAYETIPIVADEAWPGLMARHILDGEFPVVYWGQAYMGTFESFFQAIFVYLFGTIPFSVRIYPLLVGILFIFVTYKLADEMYNRSIALISLTLVSIPTVYITLCTSVVPPDNYLMITLIGSLAILLLHRVIYRSIDEERKMRYYILLGLLSGLGFWIHLLYINYIVLILLFLFIQDRFFFLRRPFWIFLLFFIIGSLPLLIYNVTHDFDTFTVAKGIGLKMSFLKLLMLFKSIIPVLLNMKVTVIGDSWKTQSLPRYWDLILGAIYVVIFLYIIVSRRKSILNLAIFSLKKTEPTVMLLSLVLISIIIFSRSARSNSWSVRYFLPVMSVVPIILSIGIYEIWKRYKVVAGIILSIFLIVHLYGHGKVYVAWGSEKVVNDVLDFPDNRQLIAFLDSKGITMAYGHYWVSFALTYDTDRRIICAQPFDERFGGKYITKYTDLVDSAKEVAFIFHPTVGVPYGLFEENLKGIGGGYKKEAVGPYTVFYDFVPPKRGEPLPHTNWTAESNYSPGDVRNAFDRDIDTRWATKSPQKPGAYFILDMGGIQTISGISMAVGKFYTDFPRGIILETSTDKVEWKVVSEIPRNMGVLVWGNDHPLYKMEDRKTEIFFEPHKVRYVKITQTGEAYPFDWSIAELYIYGPVPSLAISQNATDKTPFERGLAYEKAGLWDHAIREYEKAFGPGSKTESKEILQRLLENVYRKAGIKGKDPEERGLRLERAGRIELAKREYEKLFHPPLQYYSSGLFDRLLRCYDKLGEYEKKALFIERIKKEFSPSNRIEVNFEDKLMFLGYDIDKKEVMKGDKISLTYYWTASGKRARDYAIFVHFIQGDRIFFQNDHYPLDGKFRRVRWHGDEVFKEDYIVPIPEDIPSGEYQIIIGVWDPEGSKKRLKIKERSKERDSILIGTLRVSE